tara:strand:- start:1332 stop:1961 length:630 start_codon:yes stop_codon:yes gene_type:complete
MRLLFFTYLFFAAQSLISQDSRDFYGSNTYLEVNTLNDSIFSLNSSRDVLLDSKKQLLSLSINDSVLQFKNQLDKTDKKAFTQRTYSIRLKTNGYHFECRDKPGYLYTIDNLKLKDIIGSKISIKASYKVFRVKKKRLKLVSVEDVIIKINKGDLHGILFGIKYTYNPKDNLKKAKIKDAVKFVAVAGASFFAVRAVIINRAVLFPSLF